MKFKKEHYKELKRRVNSLDIDVKATLQNYYDKGIGKQPLVRLSFDLFFATKFSKDFRSEMREYNDNHIETVMKRIIKEVVQCQ